MSERPLQVLLVEDNPADALLVEYALEETAQPPLLHQVSRVAQAIALLEERRFDVVFIDLGLPDSSGLSSFDQLHRAAPDVPMIALTGLADEQLALEALQAGASDYLIKGQTGGALLERSMRYAIERKKTENQRIELIRAQTAQHEAEAANATKDEFLATLSHELRTPLNAILGWASLLRSQTLDEETRQQAFGTIERNARAQAQLVDDLLDVSRIITGKLALDLRPIELSEIIENTIGTLRPQIDAKNLQLELDFPPPLMVVADAVRLQQIVWNLLSNAIKFTGENGRIWVRCCREVCEGTSQIVLRVQDSGQGIESEFLPHVFDRFRQADGSTTRRHGGLGLGLSIVRHLVEGHGGTIAAHSEGTGKGATFILRLPALSLESHTEFINKPENLFAAAELNSSALLSGLKILGIDDQPDARVLIRAALSGCGAQVRLAASAHEALELVQNWRPDVIVSDVGMPDMDGYELMRHIRQLPPDEGGQTPALALTGYARDEERERALSAGFQTLLSKPFEPAHLARTVANLAGR